MNETLDDELFQDVKPFEGDINPECLLDATSRIIQRFIVLDQDQADTAALWVAHTYLIDIFEYSPIAIINAPERACGKSLFQSVLAKLVRRPLMAANASISALFRAIQNERPTILIDEADTFFKDNFDLQGMINAGYAKEGFILRSEQVGNTYATRRFSVFSAKSISGIALHTHLSDTTMSRGILFNLRRKLPHEKTERLRYADPQEFTDIASKFAKFAITCGPSIKNSRPELPYALDDRSQDNWEPLFKIASVASGKWLANAHRASLALSQRPVSERVSGNDLLRDIHEVFQASENNKISTSQLIESLKADEEKPWAQYNRGKPINPRQLAKLLSPYDISSKTVRLGPSNTPKGYERSQFQDAFERYLNIAVTAEEHEQCESSVFDQLLAEGILRKSED